LRIVSIPASPKHNPLINRSPKVSVITPLYQSAAFLREALESVEKQTFFKKNPKDLELLIIVDGTSEPFEDKIPESLKPCVQIHKIEHRGVSGARNYGIERTTAPYVAFLDGDDTWHPEKLDHQLKIFEENPETGMVYTNSYWIDKSGRILSRTQKEQYGRLPEGHIAKDMMERDYIITSSVLVQRKVFDKVGLFDTSLEVCEDWELKIRISKAFPVRNIAEPLIYYRLHAGGSHYKCEKMLDCGYEVFDRHIKDFKEQDVKNMKAFRANVPLNLAGSWLYIDQTSLSRRYLKEALRQNGGGIRLYLMYTLSYMPKFSRNLLLWVRDKIPAKKQQIDRGVL